MAEMHFRRAAKSIRFGCYSERGLMSYLMFVCLPKPKKLSKFLEQLHFPKGSNNPFSKKSNKAVKAIVFSELDFGNVGFGCPDGAIFVRCPEPMMLFIETKLNESYVKSCQTKDKDKYNSTIQGQLELRWRLSHLHYNMVQGLNGKDNHPFDTTGYVIETDTLKKEYSDRDPFNDPEKQKDAEERGSWRRLKIDDGVKEFLDKLALCKERVYFCAITDDEKNPFDRDEELINADGSSMMPRCAGTEWKDSKDQFCWMSADDLIDFTKDSPSEGTPNA